MCLILERCDSQAHTAAALQCLPLTGQLPCSAPGAQGRLDGAIPAQPQPWQCWRGQAWKHICPSCAAGEFCHGRSIKHSCWHWAAVAILPTQKPNHCPSTLHKNPHQFWQPSNYSSTSLSPMEKEMLLKEGDYVKSISNITIGIFAIDSLLSVSLWCAPVF